MIRPSLVIFGPLALLVVSSACASSGAVPQPFPVPKTQPAAARISSTDYPNLTAIVATAMRLRGTPYRDSGVDPAGFDCSGFTQYVFAQHGIVLPREVSEQFRLGKTVAQRDVAPGDLLFFRTAARGASHVGIAIGRDEFVHAPSSSGVVRVEYMGAHYWAGRFVGGRRLF